VCAVRRRDARWLHARRGLTIARAPPLLGRVAHSATLREQKRIKEQLEQRRMELEKAQRAGDWV